MRGHFEKAVADDRSVGDELVENRLLRRVILFECGPIGTGYFPFGHIGVDGRFLFFVCATLRASGKGTGGGDQERNCEYELTSTSCWASTFLLKGTRA